MKKIRVTRGGCGILYKDAYGAERQMLKTPEDEPFECSGEQADRLVRLKMAVYAEPDPVEAPKGEEPEPNAEETETIKGHLDAEDLETWSLDELKSLAAEMGLEVKGKKKADYVAAIVAEEVETSAEEEDLLPDLNVADPE